MFLGVILVLDFSKIIPKIFLMNTVCKYLFYFTLGWCFRQHIHEIDNWLKTKINVLMIISGISWGILVYLLMENSTCWFVEFITTGVGGIFFYLIAVLLANKECSILIDFSKYSLPLYLMNGYLLVVSRTIFVSKCGITSPILIIVLNMAVTLVISWIGIKFIIDKTKLRVLFGLN